MSQAVFYLARGLDGGVASATAFFDSYAAHPAGIAHELIVLAKGWEGDGSQGAAGRAALGELAARHNARILDLPDDGYDLGAYRRACARIDHDWVCCLNTHSRILVDGWLGLLRRAAEQPGVGAAGATGCWVSFVPTFRFIPSLTADLVTTKGLVGAALRAVYMASWGATVERWRTQRDFPPFPNPFLRTNAICLRREMLLGFLEGFPLPRTKQEAFLMECGHQGLTRHIEALGLVAVVAGADGRSFRPDAWFDSRTFRVPGQPNLIVADNQTRDYAAGSCWVKRPMERSAWGRTMTAAEP